MRRTEQIFIVGSSRTGTTMMGRILNNHSTIYTFKELHFFGTIWSSKSERNLSNKQSIKLLSRLLCIESNSIFNQNNIKEFYPKAQHILARIKNPTPLKVYSLFLKQITNNNSCSISCEQTPNNIFYLNEILHYFPNAKVINMIRDQRDVLLSQKNKWKRRFLGADKIPFMEAIRSYVNYHPIVMAKLWQSSMKYTQKFKNHRSVKVVRFEDLLLNPKKTVKSICNFLEINFESKMLQIPLVGSSNEEDSEFKNMIDKNKVQKWKKGGLSKSEIYLSQIFSKQMMVIFSYNIKHFTYPPIFSMYYYFSLPIKLSMSFFLNIKRFTHFTEVIKKRIFIR